VESRVLEIVGLESGSGLIMGDITVLEFPRKPLMRRESVEMYPPFFLEGICCLAGFLGESCNSGYDPGLMGMAKVGRSSAIHEGFSGRSRAPIPNSRLGLEMGEFFLLNIPRPFWFAEDVLVVKVVSKRETSIGRLSHTTDRTCSF